MSDIQFYVDLVNKAAGRIHFEGKPSNLYDPLNYILSLGGKRLRPVLTLLGCDLFAGDISKALQPALGIELFHNFSLIHDDIMDKAPLRRGFQTVHRKWSEPVAILSGDLMLVKAYEYISRTEPSSLARVMDVFSQTAVMVCEGQQLDMDFEQRSDVSADEYIQMITLKTAVLLGCALKIGALAAHADESDADLLYDYGVNAGIGFQLMDDVLDVFGDMEKVGKQVGGDILSGKKTFLLLSAVEKADEAQKKELDSWMKNSSCDPEKKISAVKEIYGQLGVEELARQACADYFSRAERLLDAIPVEQERKMLLKQYNEYLKNRLS
jgi:geranylgeranyl diphosphate synthase type II